MTGIVIRNRTGKPVGTVSGTGSLRVTYKGTRWELTHLIWVLQTGKRPSGVIDHINGDRLDNSAENLREVTQSVNLLNKHGPQKNNKLGVQGVDCVKGRYRARIKIGPKQVVLGWYDTAEEASEAYQKARLPI